MTMFDVDCPSCGRVLLGPTAITHVANDERGIVLGYRCLCGRSGRLRTGRTRRP
jgi:hypothetical protein